MNPTLRILCCLLFALVFAPLARADVTLASIFADGAVLQRDQPLPVWGTAAADEKITVTFKAQKKDTVAAKDGTWKVVLDPEKASAEPADLTVTGTNTVKVGNVLVGDVWLCSGQSNMNKLLPIALNAKEEIAAANYPLLREFDVALTAVPQPATTVNGTWMTCSPATAAKFSATAYFFGRELQKKLGVPIGLISSSWGGSMIEAWIPEGVLKGLPASAYSYAKWKQMVKEYPLKEPIYEKEHAAWLAQRDAAKAAGQEFKVRGMAKPAGDAPGRFTPSALYNGMIHPLLPMAMKGVIWYQGESNAANSDLYRSLFPALITDWRAEFGQDLPFYFVMLANFERKFDTSSQQWAFQREAQASALTLPKTGMALATDIGDPTNIHPKNKQEVGRRLALIAFSQVYGQPGEYSGPVFQSATADGDTMKVAFTHADGMTLKTLDPNGFEIAGADKVYHPAQAKVDGTTVIVSAPDVKGPVAVRYAWDNNPPMSLYNSAGLPAPPFRSDNWPAPAGAIVDTIAPDAAARKPTANADE